MQMPTFRSTASRTVLGALALLVLPAAHAAFATVPHLGRDYFGSYAFDGSASSGTFNMEVGTQTGKHLGHVSVFAMNMAEFQGQGNLKQKNTVFRSATKATGKHAPHMLLVATVGPNGDTLDGTFTLKRYHLPALTGTFSVSR